MLTIKDFKIGDRVKVKDTISAYYACTGTVEEVHTRINFLTVKLDGKFRVGGNNREVTVYAFSPYNLKKI